MSTSVIVNINDPKYAETSSVALPVDVAAEQAEHEEERGEDALREDVLVGARRAATAT